MWTTHILHKLIWNVKLVNTINMNLKNPCYHRMYLRVYPLYYIQLIMGSQVATRLLYYYWYVNKEYAQYSDSQEGKIV